MRINLWQKSLLVLIVCIILLFIFPKNLVISNISEIFSAVAVIFGIIAGFFIAATFTNYFALQNSIADEISNLVSFFEISALLNPKIKEELKEAIDLYLIRLFDYELYDYDKTWPEFEKIIKIADENIKKTDTTLYGRYLEIEQNLKKVRQSAILSARRILGPAHWAILIILAITLIFLVYIMRDAGVFSSILTVLVSSAACLILFLLFDIDSNYFAEEKLAFDTYERAFEEIGKLPYYPAESLKSKRINPRGKYRLGILIGDPKQFKRKVVIIDESQDKGKIIEGVKIK